MAIFEKIQQKMKELDMSYDELSRITGISPSSLQSYGSGRSKKVPFEVIEKLSIAFHVGIEFWLEDDRLKKAYIVSPEVYDILSQDPETPDEKKDRDLMLDLAQLMDFYRSGLLTEEEFKKGKAFILRMSDEDL